MSNPFDDLDDPALRSQAIGDDGLAYAVPTPTLRERFTANRDASFFGGTLQGAITGKYDAADARAQALKRYDEMPQWESPLEAIVALSGQLAAQVTAPENYLPIGLGGKVVAWTGIKAPAWAARMFAGAVDAGAVNAALDTAVQGIEIGAGTRETFDAGELAANIALGAAIGGPAGVILHPRVKPGLDPRQAQDGPKPGGGLEVTVTGDDVAAAQKPPSVTPPPPPETPLVTQGTATAQFAPPAPPVNLSLGDRLDSQARIARELPPRPVEAAPIEAAAKISGQAPSPVTFEDFRQTLPKDADGLPDITRIPQIIEERLGVQKPWLELNPEERVRLVQPEQIERPSGGGVLRRPGEASVEPGAEGKPQTVIPGAERISGVEDMAMRKGIMRHAGESVSAFTDRVTAATTAADLANRAKPPEPTLVSEPTIDTGLFGDRQDELFAAPREPLPGRAQRGPGDAPAAAKVQRLKDISEALAKGLDAAAVRQGRLRNTRVLGTYYKHGVVRTRVRDDFEVLSHELGHHLEEALGGPVKQLMASHSSELEPMAYAGVAPPLRLTEGFAEFIRVFVTNPNYAQSQAPGFYPKFGEFMREAEPAMLAALEKARHDYRQWLDLDPGQSVRSTIVSARKPKHFARTRAQLAQHGLTGTIMEKLQDVYTARFDAQYPLTRATRSLARLYKQNFAKLLGLKAIDDPSILAQLARDPYPAGHSDIFFGVTPYRGTNPEGPSLRDGLIMALGKPNALAGWDRERIAQFSSYLWSRRARGEWRRFARGEIPNPPDKLPLELHEANIAESEAAHPEWIGAAGMVHRWGKNLWTKKRDAGLITLEQWEDGLKIVDYVPGQRAFDYLGDGLRQGGGADARRERVKRFTGSNRDVIDPLEAMMADAYETAAAIARNEVVKALYFLAKRAGRGAGAIAEQIPVREVRALIVDPLAAAEAAAREAGLARPDIVALRDRIEAAIGDEKATLWRPAIVNEKGEPIVFWRHDGELRALRLADGEFGIAIMQALAGAPAAPFRDLLLDLFTKSAALGRLGVVADPVFAFKNALRDALQSIVLYGKPFRLIGNIGRGYADALGNREIARRYAATGGTFGGPIAATLPEARVLRDINALKAKGWHVAKLASFKGWFELLEVTETALRLGLFRTFMDEAKKRGLSEIEATFEAAGRAKDHIDFGRRGSRMSFMARVIPFLNANLQGLDKLTRMALVPLFREPLTQADTLAKGNAVKLWARLSAAVAGWLSVHALMSEDDDYRDAQTLRSRNFLFKYGGRFIAVPKPYDLAVFFNTAEALWDRFALKDPRAAEMWRQAAYATTLPPDLLEGNPLLKSAIETRTGEDIFTGRPVVPEDLQGLEPWLQYTAKTSSLAKALGQAFGVSPAWADHLIVNFTTSYGQTALSLLDYANPDKPLPGWDDVIILKGFIKDGSRNASSSRAFWALVATRTGVLETARRSWQATIQAGDAAAAEDYLSRQPPSVKGWIAAAALDAKARRLHPFERARDAVSAINGLRREMMTPSIATAAGTVTAGRAERGAADDILSKLAMTEARNALVLMQVPGYEGRPVIDISTFHRELQAASPNIHRALADRYASANVAPFALVERKWPDFERRLAEEGSAAPVADLLAAVKAAGTELGGAKIKRAKRPRIGAQGQILPESTPASPGAATPPVTLPSL